MIEFSCLECNAKFLKKNFDLKKFCNQSCAARYNNKLFPKRRPEGVCFICSKTISTSLKYCSDECRKINRSNKAKIRYKNLKNVSKTNGQRVIEWRQRLKQKAIEYKGGSCCLCGYNRCVGALEFHHRDPGEKDFGIGTGDIKSWDRVKDELDKCDLLCSNCHREEHERMSGQARI